MIHLKVKDEKGNYLINTFPDNPSIPLENADKERGNRYFKKETSFGTLEVLTEKERRVANSNQVFTAFIESIEKSFEKFLENSDHLAKEISDDYLHNIIKIHGNQKSILERCIEGCEAQENYGDFVNSVKEKILRQPAAYAEDICAFSREIRLVDYHIGGYNLLRDSSRISVTNNHNLKKFLLGLSHLFFENFNKKYIIFSLHDMDDNFLCSFEHETFNIAMHNFIENTTKYAKPYSKVRIYTEIEKRNLIFKMESIRIEKDERKKIFERGTYGSNVPEDLRGKGIGMYQLKKALERSGVELNIICDLSNNSESESDGIKYTDNMFIFTFPADSR
jgi:hypothetical protein